jgi:GntR family transcriptional regulator
MFSIDLTSRIPIYEQIYQKIINLIINGTLAENDQLPSVRSLAKSTGVNPNTVSKAYQELERNGVIYSVPGRGSFISAQNYDEFRKKVLTDFDNTVNEAFEKGISPDDLKARIETLYLSYRKDDEA